MPLNSERDPLTLGAIRSGIKVEEVEIEWVVRSMEKAEDPRRVAAGAGDEVGNGGRRGGGFVGVVEEGVVGASRVEERVGCGVGG